MRIFDIAACEERIGYSFKDKLLLRRCFTHSSYANEHGEEDNERLEFFGDSVIQFAVTEHLYKSTGSDEGKMTKLRADLVSKEPLLKAVKKLKIEEFALLGNGQEKALGHDQKLFSSIYEALVAGIYLDGGMTAAKNFIKRTLISIFSNDKVKQKKHDADSKNAFQEYVQKYKLGSIAYETMERKGPDHDPTFRVAALLNGKKISEGKGGSKKAAQAQAAQAALKIITKQGGKRK